MSEDLDQLGSGEPVKLDCLAKKAISSWSKQELKRLHEKDSSLLMNPAKLSAHLVDKMIEKAKAESESAAKILIRARYPMQAFIRATGHNPHGQDAYSVDGLLRCLPKAIEINESWIAFRDGSILMFCVPSEETLACSRFLAEMSKSPEASSVFGISGDDVSRARELISLANGGRNIAPLSQQEFRTLLDGKEHQVFPDEANPTYIINMSPQPASRFEMIRGLRQFARSPLDTTAEATKAYLGAVAKAAVQRSDDDGHGKAARVS